MASLGPRPRYVVDGGPSTSRHVDRPSPRSSRSRPHPLRARAHVLHLLHPPGQRNHGPSPTSLGPVRPRPVLCHVRGHVGPSSTVSVVPHTRGPHVGSPLIVTVRPSRRRRRQRRRRRRHTATRTYPVVGPTPRSRRTPTPNGTLPGPVRPTNETKGTLATPRATVLGSRPRPRTIPWQTQDVRRHGTPTGATVSATTEVLPP